MKRAMPEDVRLAILLTQNASRRVAGLPQVVRVWRAFEAAGMEASAFVAPQDALARIPSGLGLPERSVVTQASELDEGVWILCSTDVVIDRVLAIQALSLARGEKDTGPLRMGKSLCIGPPAEDCSGAESVDPEGVFVELDGPGSAFRAKRALIRACRKPVEIDGLVCRALGRPISGWITHFLLELPVTPNMVTAVSLLLGLTAAYFVAFREAFVLGAGLLFASWVLDNCDGEIARTKYLGSTWGAWFDIYADFVTNEAFILAMGYGLSRSLSSPLVWWVGLYTTVVLALYNAVVFAYIHRLGIPDEFLFQWWFDAETEAEPSDPSGGPPQPEGSGEEQGGSFLARFFSYVKYLGRRDFFIFFYFVCALAGILHWALWATAVGATFTGVLTLGHLVFSRRSHA